MTEKPSERVITTRPGVHRVAKWRGQWAYWSSCWHYALGLAPDDTLPTWEAAFTYAFASATFDRLTEGIEF